jgi:RNA polymerase sigma-70 factor (ECF subfamily)
MNRYRQNHLLSWLFRIAHNLMIDRVRRRRPLCSLDVADADGRAAPAERLAAAGLGPDIQAGAHELGRRIEAAAARLPVEQREVFWLRMQADLSFKEIAKIQKCSVNTALARMHYALAKLRVELSIDYRDLQEAKL